MEPGELGYADIGWGLLSFLCQIPHTHSYCPHSPCWDQAGVHDSVLPLQGPESSSCLQLRGSRSASCLTASSAASPRPKAPSGFGQFSQVRGECGRAGVLEGLINPLLQPS
jgi:hypothetical protein